MLNPQARHFLKVNGSGWRNGRERTLALLYNESS